MAPDCEVTTKFFNSSMDLNSFFTLMVLLVLLHKGKGSGLSDLFGGGVSSSYGGSSVVERNLDRITIVVGGLWFAAVIALSLWLKK